MQSAFAETLSQWRLRDILRVEPPRPCLTPPLCAQRHNVSPMFDNLSDPIFVPKDSLFLQCLTILFRPKTDCSCSAWLTPWHYVWAERQCSSDVWRPFWHYVCVQIHNVSLVFDDLLWAKKRTVPAVLGGLHSTMLGPKDTVFLWSLMTFVTLFVPQPCFG